MGELERLPIDTQKSIEVLKGNTFGIIESEGSLEEKLIRLVNLLPVAFEIVEEARSTIERLREENDRLKDIQDNH